MQGNGRFLKVQISLQSEGVLTVAAPIQPDAGLRRSLVVKILPIGVGLGPASEGLAINPIAEIVGATPVAKTDEVLFFIAALRPKATCPRYRACPW